MGGEREDAGRRTRHCWDGDGGARPYKQTRIVMARMAELMRDEACGALKAGAESDVSTASLPAGAAVLCACTATQRSAWVRENGRAQANNFVVVQALAEPCWHAGCPSAHAPV